MKQKSRQPQIENTLTLDPWLLLAVTGLIMVGLVMVASASLATAQYHTGFALFYFVKQLIFSVIAIGAIAFMLFVPTRIWEKLGPVWLIFGFIFLLLVLIPGIGREVNGSRRWIDFGPVAVQVSEAVKFCVVMYIGDYLVRHGQSVKSTFLGIIKPLVVLGLVGILLLLEPDFGATVVIFTTALGMMFMAGARLRWFYLFILVGVCAAIALVLVSPYRLERLTGFMNPWADQFGSGYQLTQALIAFGRGGIFGVGLGDGLQKLFYLPEAHTDFILAIIAEELGLVGVLGLLLLFSILVWRGLKIAKTSHVLDRLFSAYAAYGVTFWLGIQVVVSFGVNIGLLPTKGLTLPLISYGGSSLIIECMAIGLLFRIDLQNRIEVLREGFEQAPKLFA